MRKDTAPASGLHRAAADQPGAGARPPFRRVLVANRGEIAVRIIRACHELGSEAVAVYSDADADARHVKAADSSVRLGPAPASESYLRVDNVIAAALTARADAVHPGYGFLSEQPELARACQTAGIAFVGPSPATLASLGDKLAARRTAAEVGVPIVRGTFEPVDAGASLDRAAADIGWPILVKAAAGGGGRGMRRVDTLSELREAATSASREAEAAFGDGSVYLERYVEHARHVEVQLLGDAHGHVVALGERDCSVQRRHQKLVEEAPAPWLSGAQRRRLHALALSVARAVGLHNAATAEFLLEPDGQFSFLEVNARLQVEHGVTELVTGIDLVHEQLRIAAGAALSRPVLDAATAAAEPTRHAVEVRISAEDPALGFAPAPGRLTRWREPLGNGVRVDSGVEEGTVVSSYYDPLLAKVLAVAADRDTALDRLRDALRQMDVRGVQTTLPFDLWLLDEPAFRTGDGLSTNIVDRLWRPGVLASAAALRAAEAVSTAAPAAFATGARSRVRERQPAWWLAGTHEATEDRP